MLDFFYYKEHLFIVSELLRENLYDFGKYMRENSAEPYFTMPRLKKISKQILEALKYIHSLRLIHCDLKPVPLVAISFRAPSSSHTPNPLIGKHSDQKLLAMRGETD